MLVSIMSQLARLGGQHYSPTTTPVRNHCQLKIAIATTFWGVSGGRGVCFNSTVMEGAITADSRIDGVAPSQNKKREKIGCVRPRHRRPCSAPPLLCALTGTVPLLPATRAARRCGPAPASGLPLTGAASLLLAARPSPARSSSSPHRTASASRREVRAEE